MTLFLEFRQETGPGPSSRADGSATKDRIFGRKNYEEHNCGTVIAG